MSCSQASSSTFLPFQAHQQDQGSRPCHRASLRSVPPQQPPATAGGPSLSAGAPHPPGKNPTLPPWNVCYWRDVAQGKQQLLTGDPGNLRQRLKRRKAGDQRDPPEVCLLVPLQEAEFALRLLLALKAKAPIPLLS